MSIYSLTFLIFLHIERMIDDYGGWHLGVATFAMIQCMHLSSIGWDYTDGGTDPDKLSSEQKRNAIKEMPSFLEFFAAALSPTQSLAGPTSNYVDFINYIRMKGDFAQIPSTVLPCLKRFAPGLFYLVLYVVLHALFPPELVRTFKFRSYGFWTKV